MTIHSNPAPTGGGTFVHLRSNCVEDTMGFYRQTDCGDHSQQPTPEMPTS